LLEKPSKQRFSRAWLAEKRMRDTKI